MSNNKERGFTLVELMATLGILALIVAIAIPAIGSIMDKADSQATDASIKLAEKAATIAHAEGVPFDKYIHEDAGIDSLKSFATALLIGNKVSADSEVVESSEDGIYYINTLVDEGFLSVKESTSFIDSDYVGIMHEGNFVFNQMRDNECVGFREHMATDDDFSGTHNDNFRYIGSDTTVCIPHKIKGEDVASYDGMFYGTSVEEVVSDNPNITNMGSTFSNLKSTSLDISNFNTSNVTDMYGMFKNSKTTSLDLSSFDTAQVTDMSRMFQNLRATSLDLSSFDTSNVTDMGQMFWESKATNITLSDSFDTSKVYNMRGMFAQSRAINLDLSLFRTPNVRSMRDMFASSQATSLDLSEFNTENVTDMQGMFSSSQATSLVLSSFDTSKVTDMNWMFNSSQVTSLELSSFDTSSVTSMYRMFEYSQATSLDLSSFDTSNVTRMEYMFGSSQATSGYAKTQADVDRFNRSSQKPAGLNFIVK